MILSVELVSAIFIFAIGFLFTSVNLLVNLRLVVVKPDIDQLENDLANYKSYAAYLRRRKRESYLRNADRILHSMKEVEIFKRILVWPVRKKLVSYEARITKLRAFISNFVTDYVSQCRSRDSQFFSDRDLDQSQIEAIIKDDFANLVIAPAGSGKTRTLTSRIAYLVQRGISPTKILALAYTNKARDEMEGRLESEFGVDEVRVSTLHSLGFELVRKMSPNLRDSAVNDEKQRLIIKNAFDKSLQGNRNYGLDVLQFIAEWEVWEEPDSEESDTRIEQKYVTLNREKVDSIAERDIANFLFLNRVNYEHTPIAEWADRSRDYKRYEPDFYLPDYDVYLEHWGIDRNGTVAPWFRGDREQNLDPSTRYKMGMEWKRGQYTKYGKKLVESYYFEFKEGVLIENVRKRLEVQGVKFKELNENEIAARIQEKYDTLEPIYDVIVRFINTAKSNRLGIPVIQARAESSDWFSLQISLARMAIPIWKEYEARLAEAGMVDFNDMINDALALADQRRPELSQRYSHILIDEFQDISNNQLELMKCFLDPDGEKTSLFCVGDDWQNIFSFAGANIQNILGFETHFPFPETTFLKTNYRCPKNIVEASNACISNNKSQLKKEVSPALQIRCQISLYQRERSSGDYGNWEEYVAKQVLSRLLQTKTALESILVLSRYKRELWYLERHFPDAERMKLTFSTIHKAKGTEADYVLLLGCKTGPYGFPPERTDPSLYDIVKLVGSSQRGKANFEEERRLFYVALTRCRKEMYLFTSKSKKSTFVSEISRFLTQVAIETPDITTS